MGHWEIIPSEPTKSLVLSQKHEAILGKHNGLKSLERLMNMHAFLHTKLPRSVS
jgi:hypothetical protein